MAQDAAAHEERIRSSFAKQGLMGTLGATLGTVSPGSVEITLVPHSAISQPLVDCTGVPEGICRRAVEAARVTYPGLWDAAQSVIVCKGLCLFGLPCPILRGTWSPPQVLDSDLRVEPEMDAAGERIMIAYDRKRPQNAHNLMVQRSADGGGSWTTTEASPGNFSRAAGVAIDERAGVWRALYARCRSASCVGTRIYYVRSASDGAGWTFSDDHVTALPYYNLPAGVSATADGPLALWTNFSDAGYAVLMRQGTQ